MGGHPLTQTDRVKLIRGCQAAVNSRSLGYISEDPKNENQLSAAPFHLMLGRGIEPITHELYNSMYKLSPTEHWSQTSV